jgi:hypothetical protein
MPYWLRAKVWDLCASTMSAEPCSPLHTCSGQIVSQRIYSSVEIHDGVVLVFRVSRRCLQRCCVLSPSALASRTKRDVDG